MHWRRFLALPVVATVIVGCGQSEGKAGSADSGCDVVAAASATDGPTSAQQLVNQLQPGETGCLRDGTYDDDERVTVATPDITLRSYPGERATIVGRLLIEEEGRGARIEELDLDGRNPEALPSPTINASDVVLAGNDITNDHTAICVNVDDYAGSPVPAGVVIEENAIHDCGELPPTNKHHGIYLAEAEEAEIRDNWIYANADRGVQLYPDAGGTTITGNVIDGNGEGIVLAGDEDDHSDDNVVEGNAITNSSVRYNVEANWPGPVGTGNAVRRNCVFGGARGSEDGGVEHPAEGFTAEDNLVTDPGYIDPEAGDYRLSADSPCLDLLDGVSP